MPSYGKTQMPAGVDNGCGCGGNCQCNYKKKIPGIAEIQYKGNAVLNANR